MFSTTWAAVTAHRSLISDAPPFLGCLIKSCHGNCPRCASVPPRMRCVSCWRTSGFPHTRKKVPWTDWQKHVSIKYKELQSVPSMHFGNSELPPADIHSPSALQVYVSGGMKKILLTKTKVPATCLTVVWKWDADKGVNYQALQGCSTLNCIQTGSDLCTKCVLYVSPPPEELHLLGYWGNRNPPLHKGTWEIQNQV